MAEKICHLTIFRRWRCLEHECGSYNFDSLRKHEISSCNVTVEETVGVVKPKTFGGFNGNVARHYLPEFQREVREKQIQESRLQQWIHYRERKMKDYFKKRQYAYRSKKILQDQGT